MNTNLDFSTMPSKGESANSHMTSPQNKGESVSTNEIREVLPKSGLVYSERGGLAEVLCKPKILPIKSKVLLQLSKQNEGK